MPEKHFTRARILAECGIRAADEALALLEHMYPHQQPPLKTKFFLEELLGPAESK